MTPDDREGLTWLMGEIARDTKKFVAEKIAAGTEPLQEQIRELQQRVEELSQREYQGVWVGDKTYPAGASVTSGGNLWIARSPSIGMKPGTNPCWQLCVRKGRDGKDLRDGAR